MKRILIVDDEEPVRKLIAAALRKGNYQLREAQSGYEAVNSAVEFHPDLIVMDINLPGSNVDGVDATRLIRAQPRIGNCKILVISGLLHELSKDFVAQTGADAYISKPFSPIEFRKVVESLLTS